MVGRRTAPAGVRQRDPEGVERLASVRRVVDRVAAVAVRRLVALVPEVEDMAVAVRGHPRAIVDRLARRQQRPVRVQHVLAEAVGRPSS